MIILWKMTNNNSDQKSTRFEPYIAQISDPDIESGTDLKIQPEFTIVFNQ